MVERDNTILSFPELRPPHEIAALADQMFTLHWRLRQYSLNQSRMDYLEFARTAWFGPLSLNGLRLNGKDLEIQDVPIFQASEKQWREALGLAQERHQAANWLQGHDPIYSLVQ